MCESEFRDPRLSSFGRRRQNAFVFCAFSLSLRPIPPMSTSADPLLHGEEQKEGVIGERENAMRVCVRVCV